ncbi:MAG: heme-degrading domain-containing protein [Oscillospiraceae bacterium]
MHTQEIQEIIKQQEELVFSSFNSKDALQIGMWLIQEAEKNKDIISIAVTRGRQKLFQYAMQGTSVDNDNWMRRKENTVYHFFKPSYRVQLELADKGQTLPEKFGLSLADYAAAGGCFPVYLREAGMVGTITVSGLTSAEDHAYVVRAIKAFLGK